MYILLNMQLDYIFRNELLLQEFDGEWVGTTCVQLCPEFNSRFAPDPLEYMCMLTVDEPQGTIIFNQFLLPLPRVSTRDVVAMKLWIPEYLNDDGSSGEPCRAMGIEWCMHKLVYVTWHCLYMYRAKIILLLMYMHLHQLRAYKLLKDL
jgi:hypothetical protein